MDLYFNCEVRLNNSNNNFETLVTSGWIPDIDDSINIDISENISMKMYCSRKAIDIITGRSEVQDQSLEKWLRLPIKYLTVSFTFTGVEDMLANYILNSCEPINHELEEKVIGLALLIQNNIEKYVNRFIAFVRCNKGQYWLKPLLFDEMRLSSNIKELSTLVSSTNDNWSEFVVNKSSSIILTVQGSENTLVKEDWQCLEDFVNSQSRSNLALELIANAYQLLDDNYSRSSIIEACCALEAAVSIFKDLKDFSWLERRDFSIRIPSENIETQIKHLGFSSTIKILFPIIFTENEVPQEVLDSCYRAIEIRNNIVHNGTGQRKVSKTHLKKILPNVEFLCRFLLKPKLPISYIDNSTNSEFKGGSLKVTPINRDYKTDNLEL